MPTGSEETLEGCNRPNFAVDRYKMDYCLSEFRYEGGQVGRAAEFRDIMMHANNGISDAPITRVLVYGMAVTIKARNGV